MVAARRVSEVEYKRRENEVQTNDVGPMINEADSKDVSTVTLQVFRSARA